MLITLSPAKTLNYEPQSLTCEFTTPRLLEHSQRIINDMQRFNADEIAGLMSVSDKIADLTYDRFQSWETPFTKANAKQAVLAFQGQAYAGMDAAEWSPDDFIASQDVLRILSGLYGILRPLDLMQAYRLEMGTRVSIEKEKNLYLFWGSTLTDLLNSDLADTNSDTLINLASHEYFKAINKKELNAQIITPAFKEEREGAFKMISFFAKVARGQMTSYIIRNRLTDPEQIKQFDKDGYKFNPSESNDTDWVFTRKSA
ncbi:MAG TPA: peroxide stress protein YaaA [Planctomycetes bacterium]|nr:peroxide stress protein YaaA [Planctomycetaceae bacterium]HIN54594.1 peroxide stress protein YaaA [Planctomycetota bacterium]